MCVLQPPQNEGSVSFSVSWNICKHLSRLMICSSTSVSTSSVERCLVISFEVGSYSSSIIWECHSIAMWHFLSQSYIGMVSLGSMTHPLHFSVQLQRATISLSIDHLEDKWFEFTLAAEILRLVQSLFPILVIPPLILSIKIF